MTPDPEAFFGPYPHGLPIFRAVARACKALGPVEVAATKTQVSFRARRGFAWLWVSQMALHRGPPDVYLEVALPRRLRSRRIKESVEVRPGLWVHHARIDSVRDVDAEVKGWLGEAYEAGSQPPARRRKARKAVRP